MSKKEQDESVKAIISDNLYNIHGSNGHGLFDTDKCDEIASFILSDIQKQYTLTPTPEPKEESGYLYRWVKATLNHKRGGYHKNIPDENIEVFCIIDGKRMTGELRKIEKGGKYYDYTFYSINYPYGYALSNMKSFEWLEKLPQKEESRFASKIVKSKGTTAKVLFNQPKESKEDSQEQLWKEISFGLTCGDDISEFKSKYHITKKQ